MTSGPGENKGRWQLHLRKKISAITEVHDRRVATHHAGFVLPYLRPGMSLLDCGCGSGSITLGLAEAVAPGKVTGIDISESQIQVAREANDHVSNALFETGNVYELDFPDASFDAVFSHAVLEHLPDPSKALSEMYRVLKSGGLIGVRNIDADGLLYYGPDRELVASGFQLMAADYETEGGNAFFGKTQKMLLNQAGFKGVIGMASYDSYPDSESLKSIMETVTSRFEEPAFSQRSIDRGLTDRNGLREIAAGARRLAPVKTPFSQTAT